MRSSKKWISIAAILIACVISHIACSPVTPERTEKPDKKATDGDVCIDLVINRMPTKLDYNEGERFKPTGLLFDAVYENGFDEDKNLTGGDLDGWNPSRPLTASDTKVKLIFEGFEKEIDIRVKPKTLLGVEITREPDIRSYSLGDKLDLSGLVVKASYEEGDNLNELNYVITDGDGKEYKNGDVLDTPSNNLKLTVSVTSGETTFSDEFVISVYSGLSVQAEDYVDANAEKPTDRSYTVITGKKVSEVVKTDATFTGTGYIGSIDKGTKIEFNIYSEYEILNADLVLIASSTCQGNGKMEDMKVNDMFKASINGEEIYLDDDIIIEGKPYPEAGSGGNKWTNWADVPFGKIDIEPGFSKVLVECIGAVRDTSNYPRTPNIDRLDIRVGDESGEVTRGDYCTDITIKTMPKTEYKEGASFDPTGIVFDAVYRNGYDGDVDLGADKITVITNGPLTADTTEVTVKFKNHEHKIAVTVVPKQLVSIEIARLPDIISYPAGGGTFSSAGLRVTAVYDNDTDEENVQGYVITDAEGNVCTSETVFTEAGEVVLTVSLTVGEITKTATFTVTVFDGITVQAEAILASGDPVPTDASYTVLSGAGKTNAASGSGAGCVDSLAIAKDGNAASKLEFYVYSQAAMQNAEIAFTMSSTNKSDRNTSVMGDMQFNRMFKVTVGEGDGAKVLSIGDGVIVKGREVPNGASPWFLWTDVVVGRTDIAQGFNKITLDCIGEIVGDDGYTRVANVDCLTLRPSGVDISSKALQSVEIVENPTYVYYGAGATFTHSGLRVKAVYDGATVDNAFDYFIKDADGNRYGMGDALGSDKRDLELFVEMTDFAGTVKKAPFTVHVNSGNAIKVEAEAFLASGAEAPTDASYTAIKGKYKKETGKGVDKTDIIGDFTKNDTVLDFYVYSDKAVKGAQIVLTAASLIRDKTNNCTKDSPFNAIFSLAINDVTVKVGDDVVIAGRASNGDSLWFCWTENNIVKLDLRAGMNKITFKCIGTIMDDMARTTNVDKLEVRF